MRVQTKHREADAYPIEVDGVTMWHVEDEDGVTLMDADAFHRVWEEVDE